MDRRAFLHAATAAGAGLHLTGVHAQDDRRIVVSNWGGDWNERTARLIEQPLLEQKGWTVVRDINESPQRVSKLLAERRLPRGTTDINHMADFDAAQLFGQDVLEDIDYSKVANAANILPALRQSKFMPFLVSNWTVIFNPKRITTPVTGIAELWDTRHRGRVGIMDQNWAAAMQSASLMASGKLNDFEGAKRMLTELKKAVAPKILPAHQQLQAAMKADEIWLSFNWRARGLQWQKDGLDLSLVYPKEGGIPTVFGVIVPKKAPNKAGAYAYLNALLDPQGLSNLCSANFYTPATSNVKFAPEVEKLVSYDEQQARALLRWDLDYWTANNAAWADWWRKSFVA